jgi:hypothetical protein
MPPRKSITVYYHGVGWDLAIKKELRRLGLKPGEVGVVAMPEAMRPDDDKQRKLFEDVD